MVAVNCYLRTQLLTTEISTFYPTLENYWMGSCWHVGPAVVPMLQVHRYTLLYHQALKAQPWCTLPAQIHC